MPKQIDDSYDEPSRHDVIQKLPDDETFKIGQCYLGMDKLSIVKIIPNLPFQHLRI